MSRPWAGGEWAEGSSRRGLWTGWVREGPADPPLPWAPRWVHPCPRPCRNPVRPQLRTHHKPRSRTGAPCAVRCLAILSPGLSSGDPVPGAELWLPSCPSALQASDGPDPEGPSRMVFRVRHLSFHPGPSSGCSCQPSVSLETTPGGGGAMPLVRPAPPPQQTSPLPSGACDALGAGEVEGEEAVLVPLGLWFGGGRWPAWMLCPHFTLCHGLDP